MAFDHPDQTKSVLFTQKQTEEGLIRSINRAIERGANLMSIRGFSDD